MDWMIVIDIDKLYIESVLYDGNQYADYARNSSMYKWTKQTVQRYHFVNLQVKFKTITIKKFNG